MKVLLLFPMADGQTGNAIKYAFEKLGHEVLAIDAKLHTEMSHEAANNFKPDLVFCSRTYTLADEVREIKRNLKDVTVCAWNVDTRASIHEWEYLFPLIKLCDYYFVVASNLIPDWQKINPNTFWLPQGLQEEVYHKPDGINKSDILKYECDVSFAGSCTGYHRWRMPYLEAIEEMGINFKVWGSWLAKGGNAWHHPQVYNEEHNKMVACSKINLGLSGWHSNGKYVSVRDYKILGAGGFLLEFRQDGIFDVLPAGTFRHYTNAGNLIPTIKYWLENETIRKEVAQAGHDWVHSQATYTHRIQRALEIMRLNK